MKRKMTLEGIVVVLGFHFGWTKGYAPYKDRTKIYWIGPLGIVWAQDNADIENWNDG